MLKTIGVISASLKKYEVIFKLFLKLFFICSYVALNFLQNLKILGVWARLKNTRAADPGLERTWPNRARRRKLHRHLRPLLLPFQGLALMRTLQLWKSAQDATPSWQTAVEALQRRHKRNQKDLLVWTRWRPGFRNSDRGQRYGSSRK